MPEFKVDRFVDQFVIGSIVFLGAWYLHRPFWQTYFPNVAGDPSRPSTPFDAEIALVLFVVGSVVLGVLLSHSADLAVVVSFAEETSISSRRPHRRWLRLLARPFTLVPARDPRVRVVERYLASPRKEMFSSMVCAWAMSEPGSLHEKTEAVIVHQHLVAHLRALSERTKAAVEEAYAPVAFAAALFLAFCALALISALSFWSAWAVSNVTKVQPIGVQLLVTALVYLAAVVAARSVRRRFRDFANAVVTMALHFYLAEQMISDGRGRSAA
jgi:hypothetical protein